jgi:hypothetical protein
MANESARIAAARPKNLCRVASRLRARFANANSRNDTKISNESSAFCEQRIDVNQLREVAFCAITCGSTDLDSKTPPSSK